MNYDLRQYVKLIEEVLDKPTCDSIIEEIKILDKEKHHWSDAYGTREIRENELDVTFQETTYNEIIHSKLRDLIKFYQTKVLKNSFWTDYQAISKPRYNIYTEETQMHAHVDHIYSMFDGYLKGIPILSIVGVLNDSYEGGKFIMWDDFEIPFTTGSILLFPSTFLYPHRVNPIIKGTRYSFVSWVC